MARANADELMSMQTVSKSDNVAQYSTVCRSVWRGKGAALHHGAVSYKTEAHGTTKHGNDGYLRCQYYTAHFSVTCEDVGSGCLPCHEYESPRSHP